MTTIYRGWLIITTVILISGCIFFSLLFWEEARPYEAILTLLLIVSVVAFAFCIAVDIHYAVKIAAEPPLADRFQLNQQSYPELFSAYSDKLISDEYLFSGDIPGGPGCEMKLYTRQEFWGIDCFLFIYAEDYTQELENTYGSLFWDYLCRSRPDVAMQDVSLISLVCVNQLTPAFEARVNANIQQTAGRYHLPAGACLSDRTVYVPCQRGGRYRSKYKSMRSTLLNYI